MAVLYTTVEKEAHEEQIIERSRFIAHIRSVSSREEADAYIASIKAQYKDATHNVPAFVIGDKMQLQWASDDGEPQGTSGAPMVQMLVKEGITNVVVVVTRYFGGIKLGTGGLVRAYTSSLRLALDAAGRYDVREMLHDQIVVPYTLYDKIRYMSEHEPFDIVDTQFTDTITMTIEYEKDDEEGIKILLKELLRK